jgi:putative endonuclease
MPSGYTYILGSHTGTLYIGVTSDLYTRILQHRNGVFEGFSKTYGCTRLLYYEQFAEIGNAIAREKQLKGCRREKKLNLIRK